MNSLYTYQQYGRLPIHYRLQVMQQPVRARMCGFGEKDRRPVDPPPVVQLIMTTSDGSPVPLSSVDPTGFVVHADLWCKRGKEERSLVINPSSVPSPNSGPRSSVLALHAPSCTRNLMGSTTANSSVMKNHNGQQGIFFIFQDISVRTEGSFTLRFSFVDLTNVLFGCGENMSLISAEVYTEPFRVYSAKKFPGMTESTALSAAFSKQGIKIPIRTKKRHRKEELIASGNPSKDQHVYRSPPKSSSIAALSTPSSSEKSLSDEGSDKRYHDFSDSDMYTNEDRYASQMGDPNLSKRRRKESIEE